MPVKSSFLGYCLAAGMLGAFATVGALLAQPAAPTKHALLVGVNEYDHANLAKLSFAENDAQELGDLLKTHGYDAVVLTGESATRDNILKQLDAVLGKFRKGDTVVLAFAGHGLQFDEQKDCFFCPRDAKPFSDQTQTLVSLKAVYEKLERACDGSKVLLVDACRNDPDPGRGRSSGVEADHAPPPPKGVAALFSCSAGQRAFEHEKLKHGIFFHRVLKGLQGEAKDSDDEVTWDSLAGYVRKRVPDDVKELLPGRAQTPNAKVDLVGVPRLVSFRGDAPRTDPGRVKPADGKTLTVDLGGGVKLEFVRIPPGTFTMGSPREEQDYVTKTFYDGKRPDWLDRESPQHEVTISRPFYLGVNEVTVGQFRKFVEATGYQTEAESSGAGSYAWDGKEWKMNKDRNWRSPGFAQTDEHPVTCVSWNDAVKFCEWLSRKDGQSYRLPTEAEWEYSCRGGRPSNQPFGVGDGRSLSSTEVNFDGNYPYGGAAKGTYLEKTARVGSYPANAFGLSDMHGNVWEWCSDWYGDYPNGKVTDPAGPSSGSSRVLRGGGWYGSAGYCRAAYRSGYEPGRRGDRLGFRLARSPVR